MGIDWDLVIARNRLGLAAIVAALVAMAGWAGPPPPGAATLPRRLRLLILRILRPAESAVRRLILIAARGLAAEAPPARPGKTAGVKPALAVWQGRAMPVARIAALVAAGIASPYALPPRPPARAMTFSLFDPPKRFGRPPGRAALSAPRIVFLDRPLRPLPPPVSPDGPVNAHRLALRLWAIEAALGDIVGEARRLAMALARGAAERALDPDGLAKRRHRSPRRPGRPPGWRKRPVHDVDHILADCDHFAREAWPDTS